MTKFNWTKVQMTSKIRSQGTYDLEKEADHILNTDKFWQRKIGKKHKKFFKKLRKDYRKNGKENII